jgi:hypothetical protein
LTDPLIVAAANNPFPALSANRTITLEGTVATNATAAATATANAAATAAAATAALAARVAKLEAATPPVVPPVTRNHVGNGLILFHYADAWPTDLTGYSKYGAVVVGYGHDADVAKLASPATGFNYRTAVEVTPTTNISDSQFGISLQQIQSLGTNASGRYVGLLYDVNGNLLSPSAGNYACDLGHPGVQQLWLQNELARWTKEGLHAVFIDNVVPSCWFGTPANMYAANSFDNAYVSFLKYISANLPSNGYILANSGPGGSAWASRIGLYVNTLVESWTGSTANLAFITATQTAGGDAFALTDTVDPAGALAKQYAQAFHSVWNRVGGGFGIDFGAADPYNANWVSAI